MKRKQRKTNAKWTILVGSKQTLQIISQKAYKQKHTLMLLNKQKGEPKQN